MNKWLTTYYAACLILCFTAKAGAQSYDVIERRNFWNSGRNVTGIRMDSVTVSYAELHATNGSGDFRNYYEGDKLWTAGAVAKTITHTEKYSMVGSFSFNHMSGKNMCGSMFINPGYYPVDVLEFTPGRKDLQTYSFTGGISTDISPNWRLGGSIDFLSANYAKRKDLRHSNYRLDLTVSPSVMYHGDNYAIGLSYIFGKNTETIDAEEVGNNVGTYYAFLDKGLMFGAYEAWNGSGIHLDESGINGFPVKEIIHGIALQGQVSKLYVDLEYLYRSGSLGEKETIWFEFPTHSISSHIGYRFGTVEASHFARLNFSWSHQENNENVLGRETNNGITTTYKYGSNRIFERDRFSINPEYEFINQQMELTFGVEISSLKRLATQMYPYVYSQTMKQQRIYFSGIYHKKNFDFKAGVTFMTGNFTDKSHSVSTDVEPGDDLYHLTEYYNIQNEYMAATRMNVNLACRWNFMENLYAEIGTEYLHGFNLQYIEGANRWIETIKIGYKF